MAKNASESAPRCNNRVVAVSYTYIRHQVWTARRNNASGMLMDVSDTRERGRNDRGVEEASRSEGG